jgi:subtilisin family serine protease
MTRFTRRMFALFAAIGAALLASPAFAAAVIGQSLQAKLAATPPTATVEVVVTFKGEGPLSDAAIASLGSIGVKGLYMKALPIAGVIATKAQIDQIAQLPTVRSIWLNEQLRYFNGDARALTGVDRARTDGNLRNNLGLPYSGKGVGVLINDSGIDGTHPDVAYGAKTVQNVLGTTNLHAYDTLLPITYVEGVLDTDIGSGHGTHVAATAAGTGAASGGQYAGVAQGANLIGYGSGAVLLILDAIGGFDYALVNQFRYNIRVINNSWGDAGTRAPFNPDDPISVATKRLADRDIVVVFAAGNDGSGEGTIGGNYIKAPWVVAVGAAEKDGTLADFSSRGLKNGGGSVTVDGETFTWKDRPNVVAPGVDIISALANTGVLGLTNPENADYAHLQGTSMAAPHVAGVVAMMLEANPRLGWREVIDILEDTATNMQGRESWEVGAGFVNAYAAVMTAAGRRADFGLLPVVNRSFNANVLETRIAGPIYDLSFNPVVLKDVRTFHVAAGLSTVIASARVPDNTVAIVLRDPNGGRYGSAISLPLLGENIAVTAPAIPGDWTVEIRGIGSVSGVALDPLGLTNGTAAPGTVRVAIEFNRIDGFTGLNDIAAHAGRAFIERAVAERLLDSRAGGLFQPEALLTRGELADYLTQGAAVRQFRRSGGGFVFADTLPGLETAAAEAATARGAALRDLRQTQKGVIAAGSSFNPSGSLTRADLAYSLVQALGLEAEAEAARVDLADEPITVAYDSQRIALADDAAVPAALRGYVQLALDLQLMAAKFAIVQGPFDLQPTLEARFEPAVNVNRASYAFSAVNLYDRLNQAQ